MDNYQVKSIEPLKYLILIKDTLILIIKLFFIEILNNEDL